MIDLQMELLVNGDDIPYDLLALADPSKAQVDAYLQQGSCYIAKENNNVLGVVVLYEIDYTTIEIKNIAVQPSEQGKGIGKILLRYATDKAKEQGYKQLTIGTGNSSIGQLALYQKAGFEIMGIKQNFFLEHYEEPIFENGIQCKHMIMLAKYL